MRNEIRSIGVVGLGYVGLPLALAFARHKPVVGFDTNESKLAVYREGKDPTCEVGDAAVAASTIEFTSDAARLGEVDMIVVAVPTPIHGDKTPNLDPVTGASEIVGKNLKKGAIVVYESTVYPGVTEEVCKPILEKESGMICGEDFFIGYSPERINPGDKVHRLENIVKIVSGMDDETMETIAKEYEQIIEAGVFRAGSIKVAEAAKLVENSQRDINIAFMNELAMVFERMDISTSEVVAAMNTKWNALGFYPGLVGGHCIGVDPYYFVYQAEQLGYHSQIIASGRKVNDDMPYYVGEMILKQMILADVHLREAKVVFMGVTFKENCPDIRNTKVKGIIRFLESYNIKIEVCDPWADPAEVERSFGKKLVPMDQISDADCMVFTVAHKEFAQLGADQLRSFYKKDLDKQPLLMDVRSMFNAKEKRSEGYWYWSL